MSKNYKELFEKLKVVSDEHIAKLNLTLKDLWLIKFKDKTLGPYTFEQLDNLTHDYSDLLSLLEICNIEDEKWDSFFNHTCFERRERVLFEVADEIQEETKNLLIMKDGQKLGPYGISEVKEQIEAGTINITDDISTDWGKTWFKLYQHNEFDRRSHDQLPTTPAKDQFESSKMEIIQTESVRLNNDKQDILVGLAYSNHTERQKSEISIQNILKPVTKNSMAVKKMAIAGCAGLFIVFFLFKNKVNQNEGDVATDKTITSKYSSSKKNKATKNTKRVPSSENETNKAPTTAPVKKENVINRKAPVRSYNTNKRKRIPSRAARKQAQREKYRNRKRKIKTYEKFHSNNNETPKEEKFENEYSNDGKDDFPTDDRDPASGQQPQNNQRNNPDNSMNDDVQNYE